MITSICALVCTVQLLLRVKKLFIDTKHSESVGFNGWGIFGTLWKILSALPSKRLLFLGFALLVALNSFVPFQIWDKMFVPLHCLNFGIGGDQTQNVLWRLQNGELEDFAPKVCGHTYRR